MGWEVAKDPITNNADYAVGPGLQFAKTLIAQDPDITVGLIPLAVGGTEIAYWFEPYQGYYDWAWSVRKAKRDGTLSGILWHQGEGIRAIQSTPMLTVEFDELIDMIRRDLQDPFMPFIVGGLTSTEAHVVDKLHLRDVINAALKKVGTDFYRTGYVRSQDVPFVETDQEHFSSDGQRIMGERYAIEYLRLTGWWTAKGKEWLDSESEDNGDGWKYHPDLGVYHYDEELFPIIKHAQLGWLTIDIDQDHVIRLDLLLLGNFA